MKILKIFFYTIFVMLIIGAPIYSFSRIILPDWIKSEIAARLPEGSYLSIGKINSYSDMSIIYEDIEFKSNSDNFKLKLENLRISPQLSFKKPLIFKANKAQIETNDFIANISNFKSNVTINYSDISNPSIVGKLEKLSAGDLAIVKNIQFFLMGINSQNSKINLEAEDFEIKLITPNGAVIVIGDNAFMNTILGKEINTEISSKNVKFDFRFNSNLEIKNELYGNDLNFGLKFIKKNVWTMPLKIRANNLLSKNVVIADEFNLSAIGKWQGSNTQCALKIALKQSDECGKLTDIVDVDLKIKDKDSILKLEGDGFCVTPNAGCPQRIKSSISTVNTSKIFSKIISTDIINPIFVGVVMGSLLSSPASSDSEYEHKVDFEVEGSKIKINGDKVF